MNTAMWEHPLTAQQVGQLKAFGYVEIPCVSKKLVCGDQGRLLTILNPKLSKVLYIGATSGFCGPMGLWPLWPWIELFSELSFLTRDG